MSPLHPHSFNGSGILLLFLELFQMVSTNQNQDFAVELVFACHTFSISSALLRQVLLGFLAGSG